MGVSGMKSDLVKIAAFDIEGDFSDPGAVWFGFLSAANALSTTVLKSSSFIFPGGGMTGVVILAESHAAIHTWPEEGRAFGELATCGSADDLDRFPAVLSDQGWRKPRQPAEGRRLDES